MDMTNIEAVKELGNKAFFEKDYEGAVTRYTECIEMSKENPNHIYFSNRSQCYLQLQ